MITLEAVSKSFDGGRSHVVRRIDLSVAPAELVVLLGESGCGKTTTLKMINRLIEPTSGSIVVDNQRISDVDPVLLRRRIGYVFQGIGLFPHMTVFENAASVLHLLNWTKPDIVRRIEELLILVGLSSSEYRDRYPAELSGGQKQRVGFARALAARPKVMLMDEPFGALDPITRAGLQTEFRQLQRKLGLTVVMVTHDMTEALLMADRIAVIERGEVVRVGTPHELLSDTGHPYVAELLAVPKRQADELEALAKRGGAQ